MSSAPAVHLCFVDGEPLTNPDPNCPRTEMHTPQPSGYIQWHEWARAKGKTHRCVRCPGCGLYRVWLQKPKKAGKR